MKPLKIFILVISSAFLFTFCDNSTNPSEEEVEVEISKEYLADQLGDKNEEASENELVYVEDYFKTNSEMWLITDCMSQESESVNSDTVLKYFLPQSKPYSSEEKLRNENIGISIRTPWIGITVLQKTNSLFVTKTYRSPGPNFASVDWIKLKILR